MPGSDQSPDTFRRAAVCAVAAARRACNELQLASEAGSDVEDLLALARRHERTLLSVSRISDPSTQAMHAALSEIDRSLSAIALALREAAARYRNGKFDPIIGRLERAGETRVQLRRTAAPRRFDRQRRLRDHA